MQQPDRHTVLDGAFGISSHLAVVLLLVVLGWHILSGTVLPSALAPLYNKARLSSPGRRNACLAWNGKLANSNLIRCHTCVLTRLSAYQSPEQHISNCDYGCVANMCYTKLCVPPPDVQLCQLGMCML